MKDSKVYDEIKMRVDRVRQRGGHKPSEVKWPVIYMPILIYTHIYHTYIHKYIYGNSHYVGNNKYYYPESN